MRDPDKLIELAGNMDRPRELYLKWKQVVEHLERQYKAVLASEFLKAEGRNVKERESIALASEVSENFRKEMDNAEKEKIKAQVKYESIKANFDAYQSALSFDKETIKRGV